MLSINVGAAMVLQDSAPDSPRAHRVKAFCELVGISRSTFWKYTRLGKIRVIRIGGRVLVPHAEAMRIIAEGVK